MTLPDFYDRDGEVITLDQYVTYKRSANTGNPEDDYSQVAWTELHGLVISTVWVGVPVGFSGGMPCIFSTLVNGGTYDGQSWDWATEEEARAGHRQVVRCVLEGLNPQYEVAA